MSVRPSDGLTSGGRNGNGKTSVHSQAEKSRPNERAFPMRTGGDTTATSMKTIRGILLVKSGAAGIGVRKQQSVNASIEGNGAQYGGKWHSLTWIIGNNV